MKKNTLFPLLTLFLFSAKAQVSEQIRLNQVGFYTKGPKVAAIINSSATDFEIKSPNRAVSYYSGKLSSAKTWTQSGESVTLADFSSFDIVGNYVLEVKGLGYSYPFTIKDDALAPLNKLLMKAFYFNRASVDLDPAYAGKWARVLGHPDDKVIVHPSAASTLRPAGTTISSPKGWYDAGDYNCYIVNSGISTYTLLAAYEHFKPYYDTLNLNIPESNNNTPDILDEIKWNLDWMLTMQDPNDGGVYFKKTNANFDGMNVMPENAVSKRYVVTKSTSSAFDFAAVMAVAYRIYKEYDLNFANTCLSAAKKAYDWGIANPQITFSNPPASGTFPRITTGGYGDSNLDDEMEWAGNELYIATLDNKYYSFISSNNYGVPSWPSVRVLGLYSLLFHRKKLTSIAFADTVKMKNKLIVQANDFVSYQSTTSPYQIVMGRNGNNDFIWGSNAVAANQAMMLLNAYFLTNNQSYASAALSQVDYLTGRNATGYCFVTGIGSKPVMRIHHRQSEADGILDPVPGWVAGGPTGSTGDGCSTNTTFLAKSFSDSMKCYTKNEVAINWNAPAVYITGGLEFLKPYNLTTGLSEYENTTINTLSIFPVPAQELVHITFKQKQRGSATLSLIDGMGREQVRQNLEVISGENSLNLPLNQVPSGIYFLNIQTAQNTLKGKLVVEKP